MGARGPKPGEGGRPRKPLDWDKIAKMCAIQCTQEEISDIYEISIDRLNERCKEAHGVTFKEFRSKNVGLGKQSLRRKQYQKAVEDGNPTMLIWLGKQYLGQSDDPEKIAQEERHFRLSYDLDKPEDD